MGDNGSSVTRSKTCWTDSISVPNKNRLPAISLKRVQGNKSARADRNRHEPKESREEFSMASATALGREESKVRRAGGYQRMAQRIVFDHHLNAPQSNRIDDQRSLEIDGGRFETVAHGNDQEWHQIGSAGRVQASQQFREHRQLKFYREEIRMNQRKGQWAIDTVDHKKRRFAAVAGI